MRIGLNLDCYVMLDAIMDRGLSVPGCPRHDLRRFRLLDDVLEEVRLQRRGAEFPDRRHHAAMGHPLPGILPRAGRFPRLDSRQHYQVHLTTRNDAKMLLLFNI